MELNFIFFIFTEFVNIFWQTLSVYIDRNYHFTTILNKCMVQAKAR